MVNSSAAIGLLLCVDPPQPLRLMIRISKTGTTVEHKRRMDERSRTLPARCDVCLTYLRVRHPATNQNRAFAAVFRSIPMQEWRVKSSNPPAMGLGRTSPLTIQLHRWQRRPGLRSGWGLAPVRSLGPSHREVHHRSPGK